MKTIKIPYISHPHARKFYTLRPPNSCEQVGFLGFSSVIMANRMVSSVPIHKVKLMKRGKRKKFLLKRVIDYLKSDTYMFTPLISSKLFDFRSAAAVFASSPGIGGSEPILEKNENLLGKVKDYMISDQYLYAPLVEHMPLFRAAITNFSPQDKGPAFGLEKTDKMKPKER